MCGTFSTAISASLSTPVSHTPERILATYSLIFFSPSSHSEFIFKVSCKFFGTYVNSLRHGSIIPVLVSIVSIALGVTPKFSTA